MMRWRWTKNVTPFLKERRHFKEQYHQNPQGKKENEMSGSPVGAAARPVLVICCG